MSFFGLDLAQLFGGDDGRRPTPHNRADQHPASGVDDSPVVAPPYATAAPQEHGAGRTRGQLASVVRSAGARRPGPPALPPSSLAAHTTASLLLDGYSERRFATYRLVCASEDVSFGVVLNGCSRVVVVDPGGPADVAGLRLLDHVLLCDGVPTSAKLISGQVAGRLTIQLALVRPEDGRLCRIAREQELLEWVHWEASILACTTGNMKRLLDCLCELHLLGRAMQSEEEIVATRRISEQEAAAMQATHGITVRAGERLDRVAADYGQEDIRDLLQQTIVEMMGELDLSDVMGNTGSTGNVCESSRSNTSSRSNVSHSTATSATFHSAASTPRGSASVTSSANSTPRGSGSVSSSSNTTPRRVGSNPGSFRDSPACKRPPPLPSRGLPATVQPFVQHTSCSPSLTRPAFQVSLAAAPEASTSVQHEDDQEPPSPPFVPLHTPRSPLRAPNLDRWGAGTDGHSSRASSSACSSARSDYFSDVDVSDPLYEACVGSGAPGSTSTSSAIVDNLISDQAAYMS